MLTKSVDRSINSAAGANEARTLRSHHAAPGREEHRAASQDVRARVLIAEDNPVNVDIGRRILEGLGYEVVVVENGSTAVQMIAGEEFGAVLMDCEMPGINGIEATRLIRAAEASRMIADPEKRYHHVPVIALTSYSSDEKRDACVAAGMDDFVSKPLTQAKLRDALGRWIRAQSPRSAQIAADFGHAPDAAICWDQESDIDRNALMALVNSRPTDGPMFLKNLLRRFELIARGQVEDLWQQYRAEEPAAISTTAHTLKSGAGALGATRLAARADEVERHVRERGLPGMEPLLVLLEKDLSTALRGLSSLVGEHDGAADA